MRMMSIASGSSGNCIYIGTDNAHILVDAGISKKRILEGLSRLDLTLSDIDAVLITHEHDDHIRSLSAVLRKSEIVCYMTKGTYDAMLAEKGEVLKKLLVDRFESGYIILLNRLEKSINYPDILSEVH